MEQLAFFILGVLLGAAIVFIINHLQRRNYQKDLSNIVSQMEQSFNALSFQALTKSSGEFIKLANETLSKQTQLGGIELEGKKKLIDHTLEAIKGDLQKVEKLVTDFEKDRADKFSQLSTQLKLTAEQTGKLQETTGKLQETLGNTRIRGQWGERIAEDVLRVAGFIEGINYLKQKNLDTTRTRPDYIFLLPQGLKVNMDVKFPMNNYLNYLNTESESDKQNYKTQFLGDVRLRIKEVTGRDYINPEENTLDYALVFIPNEQVYRFIHENDSSILDEALKNKIILCSPITLFAILAIIRQAIDNFNLEKTAAEILGLLGAFNKQWNTFKESMDKMGKRIEDAHKEYTNLVSTRQNQLERPLRKIEDLRKHKQIEEASLVDDEVILIENANELAVE